MERNTTFYRRGRSLQPLILFAMPVLFALFFAGYVRAVDLLVVGKFGLLRMYRRCLQVLRS